MKPDHFPLVDVVKSKLPEVVLVWSQMLVLEARNHWPKRQQQYWQKMNSQYIDLAGQQNGHTHIRAPGEERWEGSRAQREKWM